MTAVTDQILLPPSLKSQFGVQGYVNEHYLQRIQAAVPKKVKRAAIKYFRGGGVLVTGDYSQLEIWVAAILANEVDLIDALVRGEDIHAYVASQVFPECFGMSVKDIKKHKKEFRSAAKGVVFGLLYGKSFNTPEMADVAEKFFTRFWRIKEWIESQHAFVKQYGYVDTNFGRYRALPDGMLSGRNNISLVNAACRRAVNTPIQSTASDCAFIACTDIGGAFTKFKLLSRFLGGVHDSILVDSYPGETFYVCDIMKHATSEISHDFMNGIKLNFDLAIGHSWGRQLEVKKNYSEDGRRYYVLEGGDVDFAFLKRDLQIGIKDLQILDVSIGDPLEASAHEWVPQSKNLVEALISVPDFSLDYDNGVLLHA